MGPRSTAPAASNREGLEKLITLVANFEKAIYASTGTKNRERGRWCGSVQRQQNTQNVQETARRNRYVVLNINNLATGDKPTVEFRAFGASLNTTKVIGYLRLCLALVERALKVSRKTKWIANKPVETSPIHREGEGQTELTRLFYQLGWTKGRVSYVHGEVTAEGAPSLKTIKKELMRLAKKYDQQP